MKTPHYKPPRLAAWLLKHVLPDGGWQTPLGDFEEYFNEVAAHRGLAWARLWYWGQVLNVLPRKLCHSAFWGIIMLANYLKVAFRTLAKRKGYAFINISGLAIGIACCMLIFLWVRDERSYDRFHENADRIYRVLLDPGQAADRHEAVSPAPLGGVMKESYPDVEKAVRITRWRTSIEQGENRYDQTGAFVDIDFLTMFSFPLLEGDPTIALANPYSIVISEKMASRYFGESSPTGHILRLGDTTDFTVTGVLKNLSGNSHLQFDFLVPTDLESDFWSADNWGNVSHHTYLLLSRGANITAVTQKLNDVVNANNPRNANTYYLQPLTDIHLRSNFNFDIPGHGNLLYVQIFSIIALVVLVGACINYMNLSTARSGRRAREIGLRKVVGAHRRSIAAQFVGESVFMTAWAGILAIIIVELSLSQFNALSGKNLAIDYTDLSLLSMLFGIVVLTGILAGSYPALYLSSFQPVSVLKGLTTSGTKGRAFRNTLVLVQFSLAIILIIGAQAVKRQIDFVQSVNLGFEKENLVYLDMRGDLAAEYETMKERLMNNPNILSVAASNYLPMNIWSGTSNTDWEERAEDHRVQMQVLRVNYDFLHTYGMEIVGGRGFSRDFVTDASKAVILNEAAVRAIGLEAPIGKRFSWGETDYTIIGIVKDFHYKPLSISVEPLFMQLRQDAARFLSVRIRSEGVDQSVASLKELWASYRPDDPFEFHFLDETLDQQYGTEEQLGKITMIFTLLAIFISCLGLLGLASYVAERRIKEIGIRKIVGASVPRIVWMLSMDMVKWVAIALVIAWPLGFFVIYRWLENYAVHFKIGLSMFVMAGLLTLVVAFLTVSFQSLRAALLNPVEALKYE